MSSTLFGTFPCHHYTTNIKLDLNGNVIIALISKMVASSKLNHCGSNFIGNTYTEAHLWHLVQQTFVTHEQRLKSKATPVSVMVMIIGPFLSFLCFVQYSLVRQGTEQTKGFTIHLEHEKDVFSVTLAAQKKKCN